MLSPDRFRNAKQSTSSCSSEKQEAFLKVKSETGDQDLVFYPTFQDTIPEEFRYRAEQELNETAENKTNGMRHLKEVLKREKKAYPGDDFLVMILRGCKYDLKKSETKLKRSLRLRQEIIKHLANTEWKKIEIMVDDMTFAVLPYRDKLGRTIFYTRSNHNLDLYKTEEVMYCYFAFLLFLLRIPMTAVCGFAYICDSKCKSHFTYLQVLKDVRKAGTDGMLSLPARYGRADFINEFSIIRWLVTAILAIIPQKLGTRVQFHGSDLQSLCQAYHPDILPSDFGGNLGPISNACYRQKFLDFIEELRAEKPET